MIGAVLRKLKDNLSTAKQVFDVSGAGDTVVSTLAACQLLKMSVIKSIKIANLCWSCNIIKRHEAYYF